MSILSAAMARGVFLALVLLVATAAVAAAAASSSCVETFPVAGLKCKLRNRAPDSGEREVCPEGNPSSTVTFCKRRRTVQIVGLFAAADLGVCDPGENPYALPAGAVVKYEQYGDQVVLRIPGRVPASFRCLLVAAKKVCVGLAQRTGVSYLTDCVPAAC